VGDFLKGGHLEVNHRKRGNSSEASKDRAFSSVSFNDIFNHHATLKNFSIERRDCWSILNWPDQFTSIPSLMSLKAGYDEKLLKLIEKRRCPLTDDEKEWLHQHFWALHEHHHGSSAKYLTNLFDILSLFIKDQNRRVIRSQFCGFLVGTNGLWMQTSLFATLAGVSKSTVKRWLNDSGWDVVRNISPDIVPEIAEIIGNQNLWTLRKPRPFRTFQEMIIEDLDDSFENVSDFLSEPWDNNS
jgi:hypothetical protein